LGEKNSYLKKIIIIREMMVYGLTDSEESAASRIVVAIYQTTWHHTPETVIFAVTTVRTLNLT
jgi:hypothetical protein